MKPYKYINRYDDVFTFTPLDENTILMEGDFKYMRAAWPNNYTLAYEKYLEEGGELSIKDFKKVVHDYDEVKKEYVYKSVIHLVTSDTSRISMIDPSGGPYIALGMSATFIHPEIKDKVIEDIINDKKGYKLIIK